MVQQMGRGRITAEPVTFIVQHELWDGNLQTTRIRVWPCW